MFEEFRNHRNFRALLAALALPAIIVACSIFENWVL